MTDYRNLKKALLQLDREEHHLSFLKSCREYGVILKFLQCRSYFVSKHCAKGKYKFEINCLNSCIRAKHALLASIKKRIYGYKNDGLYYKFSCQAVGGVFDFSMMRISEFRDEQNRIIAERHRKKLLVLTNGMSSTSLEKVCGFVNLSDHTFNSAQLSILNKGPKFVPHSRIPPQDYIPQLEDIVKKVDPSQRNNLRCQMYLEYSRFIKKDYLTVTHEDRIIKSIRDIPNLQIICTDKSNKLAAINKTEYIRKMDEVIASLNCSIVNVDPLPSIINKSKRLVKEFKTSDWSDSIRNAVKVNSLGLIPKLIAVIKDHKQGMPLRPIVVRCESPTFFIEKTMVLILKEILPTSPHVLSSTFDFVQRLESFQLPSNFTMYSLDVIALYPSVDMHSAAKYVSDTIKSIPSFTLHMQNTIISAFQLIINSNYFRFNNKIFFQSTGAPMGSPISGLAAECIMRPLEESFIATSAIKPICWLRFVDDIFIIWTGSDAEFNVFLTNLNLCNQKIQFTVEKEVNECLPYLDVLLERKAGYISRSVFRKKINSNCTIPNDANTSKSQKQAAFKSQVNRAFKICSPDKLDLELDNIRNIAIRNSYPLSFVNNIISTVLQKIQHPPIPLMQPENIRIPIKYFKGLHEKLTRILKEHNIQLVAQSSKKLKDTLKTPIDVTPPMMKPGVYEIPISHPDGTKSFYIGQTTRMLKTRIKEHQNDVKNAKQTSAISRAVYSNPLLSVQFNEAKIVSPFSTQSRTVIRESIEIYRRRTEVINDQDSYSIPAVWLSLLN